MVGSCHTYHQPYYYYHHGAKKCVVGRFLSTSGSGAKHANTTLPNLMVCMYIQIDSFACITLESSQNYPQKRIRGKKFGTATSTPSNQNHLIIFFFSIILTSFQKKKKEKHTGVWFPTSKCHAIKAHTTPPTTTPTPCQEQAPNKLL